MKKKQLSCVRARQPLQTAQYVYTYSSHEIQIRLNDRLGKKSLP